MGTEAAVVAGVGGGSVAAICATTESALAAGGGEVRLGVWACPRPGQDKASTASIAAARRSNFRCIAENLIAFEQGRLVNATIPMPLYCDDL